MSSNPVYYDVISLLTAGGFGALGSDIFGGEWGEPDVQVLVLGGDGFPSAQPDIYEQPGVQIIVRGARKGRDFDVYTPAKAISDYLLTLSDNTTANGVCYKGFEEASNIAPMGKDANERFMYSMNFYTWRNRT